MAQRTQVLYVDDIDGSEAAGTVRFGLGGTDYEIDLNQQHAEQLTAAGARLIPRWFAQLAGSAPPAPPAPVALTVVPEPEPEPAVPSPEPVADTGRAVFQAKKSRTAARGGNGVAKVREGVLIIGSWFNPEAQAEYSVGIVNPKSTVKPKQPK